MMTRFFVSLTAAAMAAMAAACAGISLGDGTQNDPVPSGTVVFQGPLQDQNGFTVSGNVSIYEQLSGGSVCTYVVRLSNLAAPSGYNLQVVPQVNGAPGISPTLYTLRSPTGNENYIFSGVPCGSSWAEVLINNPTATPGAQTYGLADLTAVGS